MRFQGIIAAADHKKNAANISHNGKYPEHRKTCQKHQCSNICKVFWQGYNHTDLFFIHTQGNFSKSTMPNMISRLNSKKIKAN